jgi:mannose-6-phosphate isomerase-like protein (cupin superfamily)
MDEASKAVGRVRRIVTGHDARGRSIVTHDGDAPSVHTNPKRVGYVLTQLWATDATPAPVVVDAPDEPDPTLRPLRLEPPKNGTVVRIITFGPEGDWIAGLGADGAQQAWGVLGAGGASTNQTGQARHPFMHRTQSVDYALILDGEITLVLDDSEVLMKTGDFLVERGTNHAWANRSGRPCKILFVLIDGQFDPALAQHFARGGH